MAQEADNLSKSLNRLKDIGDFFSGKGLPQKQASAPANTSWRDDMIKRANQSFQKKQVSSDTQAVPQKSSPKKPVRRKVIAKDVGR